MSRRNMLKFCICSLAVAQVHALFGRILNVPNLTVFSLFFNMELPAEQIDDHFAIGKFLTSLPLSYRYISSHPPHHKRRFPRDEGLRITPFEKLFDALGLDGKRIVLHHICISAMAPQSDAGFLVEILDTVLKYAARYHYSLGDKEYMRAYEYGLERNDCRKFSGGPSLFRLQQFD